MVQGWPPGGQDPGSARTRSRPPAVPQFPTCSLPRLPARSHPQVRPFIPLVHPRVPPQQQRSHAQCRTTLPAPQRPLPSRNSATAPTAHSAKSPSRLASRRTIRPPSASPSGRPSADPDPRLNDASLILTVAPPSTPRETPRPSPGSLLHVPPQIPHAGPPLKPALHHPQIGPLLHEPASATPAYPCLPASGLCLPEDCLHSTPCTPETQMDVPANLKRCRLCTGLAQTAPASGARSADAVQVVVHRRSVCSCA